MATKRFVRSVAANLTFWRDKIAESEDPTVHELIPETQNIYRAIEFGLALDETWCQAAELIAALEPFIEPSGAWRSWQGLIQESMRRCASRDPFLTLRLLDLSGQCYRKSREWDAARAAYLDEERMALELGAADHVARAHHGLGTLYWRMRDYDTAMHYSLLALAEFQATRAGERLMGGVQANIGLIEYGRGQFPAAIEAFHCAIGHFRRTNNSILLARSLVNLALAQEGAGKIERAAESYLEARSILEQTGFEIDKARLELSLGALYFHLNRFDEAEQSFLCAYSPYLKRSGQSYLLGLATNNLGAVYIEKEEFARAEVMLERSLSHWLAARAELQLANTTGNLGKVRAAQGRTAEALEKFDSAISTAEAFADDAYARFIRKEFQEEKERLLQRITREGQKM
ncbi:MAG: tetratricopeptide repeat protein [Candidatus Promineifilaceae bacterium]